MRGSEVVVRMLDRLGVEVIFGLCGDTTLPLYESLHDLEHGIRHVLTRDERSAGYMADAYARLSGRVGVCEGPSGGGATYILPGVAEANDSSVPLVCLTSDIAVADRGRSTLTELDQTALFRPVTRFTAAPERAAELALAIAAAFERAAAPPHGAAHVRLPYDVQLQEIGEVELDADPATGCYPWSARGPEAEEVRALAARLLEARRPLLVAGAGVLRSGAWEELRELAHLLGAPAATSISGKGSLAETDPWALGVIGSNGGLPYRRQVVREADLVLFVGCSQGSVTTEKWTLPADGEATVLVIDARRERIGRNYSTELGVVADARLALAAVLEETGRRLGGRPAARWDPEDLARRRRAEISANEAFTSEAMPIRPERFLTELGPLLPDDAVLCVDPGTPCPYLAGYYRLPRAGRWFVSPRAHGALGYALPAVCGAYFARPDSGRVVGVMGDGSFGCSVGELETLVRLELPVTLIVLNNSGYGWIKAGQRGLGGKYFSVDLSACDHARVAAAYGLRGLRVEAPGELRPALEEALGWPGPALVDVVVQPLEEARAPVSKWIA